MRDWLISPSLGQYLQVQPEKEKLNGSSTNIQSTKMLIKKHMVDNFFEQALHQVEPDVESLDDQAESIDQTPPEKTNEQVATGPDKISTGYYVFAIVLNQCELQLPETQFESDFPLYTYPLEKIQAVISEVPLDVYGENALQSRLNDSSWFENTLRAHNALLGKIQDQAPMVPMRVCTICDSMESLNAFLREHQDDFEKTLNLVENRESWSFSIVCNQRKVRLLTERASSRIRAIYVEMAGQNDEKVRLLTRQLEAVLQEEAHAVCKACVKHCHGALSALSDQVTIQTPAGGEATMQEIFRSEYSIKAGQHDIFLSEISSLAESYKPLGFELHIEQSDGRKELASSSAVVAEA